MRLSYEEEKLLDDEGYLCVGMSSRLLQLDVGIDSNLTELITTIKYSNGTKFTWHVLNNTVSLGDINLQNFEVVTRASYNTLIVTGTSCTQVENKINGTMITLYQTNPNASEIDNITTTKSTLYRTTKRKFTTRRMPQTTGTSKTTVTTAVTTTYEPSQSDTNGKLGTVITILMLHLLMFVFAYFASF